MIIWPYCPAYAHNKLTCSLLLALGSRLILQETNQTYNYGPLHLSLARHKAPLLTLAKTLTEYSYSSSYSVILLRPTFMNATYNNQLPLVHRRVILECDGPFLTVCLLCLLFKIKVRVIPTVSYQKWPTERGGFVLLPKIGYNTSRTDQNLGYALPTAVCGTWFK